MASAKKRKIGDEGRMFNKEWENSYFFVEIREKPVCLVCGKHVAAMKKSNLQRHYDSCHGNLEKLTGQARQNKIAFLKRGLNAQQIALQRYCKTDNEIIQTSNEISELIAKKLKSHIEGEFVKECIVPAAKLIAPEKVAVFEKNSLLRRTVSSRIQEMGNNIEKTLKDKAQDFEFFTLALDETTDITNTAQLTIFIRGVISDFKIQEDLLSLESMHGTTRCEDLFDKLRLAMRKSNLPFEKLGGIATDDAPAMVGSQKRLTALLEKELTHCGLAADDLVAYHCIIHQQNLCAKSLRLRNVMSTVIKCINFTKSRGLNSRLFKKLLEDLNADYHNLIYYCEVRWMSRSEMLTRFYFLRNEIGQIMDMQVNPVVELSDNRWLCDLAFMVDISKHFSELNIKLQGPNQLLNSMFAKVKSFETKLQL